MVKILHTADMHLDSPFTIMDASMSHARRSDLRAAFTSMMMYIKDNNIDLVLIAGDMFEHEYITKSTVNLVLGEFAKLPQCKFVIAPGNHDPYTPESVYKKTEFPKNVYIFTSPDVSMFSFDDLGVDVYGYAFTKPYMAKCPAVGRMPVSPDRINILLAHADTSSPISKYAPFTEGDISRCGYDYVALGHIHQGKEPTKVGDTYYAYSGCLEGRDYSEEGHKGALVGEIDKNEQGFSLKLKPVRFSRRRYADERLNVTGSAVVEEIIEAIQNLIVSRAYGDDTLLRLTLEGNVTPDLVISKPEIESRVRSLYSFELIDNTLPLFDQDKLKCDPTLRGSFYRMMLPKLESSSREEREIAALALRYGLSAIEGEDTVDF